jgi:H+/gluconate symporter-like permease
MLDMFVMVAALALLMYFAFRGVTLLILAPAIACTAAALGGGLPMLGAYTQIFMRNMGEFAIAYFPLFLLGAIFGKLMDDSGCAGAIARGVSATLGAERAVLAVVVCCALLTYGGVSLFVVAFAIFPVAAALFRDAGIPKRLIPAALALGAFTFTMSALPGTPAIQNAIPMPVFGTTAFAAPGLGLVAAALMLTLGMLWLNGRAARARAAGEGYGAADDAVPATGLAAREGSIRDGFDVAELGHEGPAGDTGPAFLLAVAPVAIVVLVNFAFLRLVAPALDTAYLEQPLYGATTIEAVRGVWAIIVALLASIGFLVAVFWTRFEDLKGSLDHGANASVIPIANTASLVGFGAVIAAMPAFATISDGLLALGELSPLVSLAVAVNVLSAITGSASGGMSIALDSLGPTYVELAQAQGVSLEAMHRVTSISSGALDALPHNGAVITVLGICKVTHGQAYGDVFMVAVVGPMLSLVAVVALATLFGSF